MQALTKISVLTLAAMLSGTTMAQAPRVVANPAAQPLVRDRDPLLPDSFSPPRSLVFVTRDDPEFVRFLGRVRPVVEARPPSLEVQPEGVEVIDGADADRDGYVEYFDGRAYVAELKKQKPLVESPTELAFTGTIRETHLTRYERHDAQHLLLRLAHDDGKHALVDAGPASALTKLNLRTGDVVTVVARLGLVNDRPALIADQLTHASGTVKIVRHRDHR